MPLQRIPYKSSEAGMADTGQRIKLFQPGYMYVQYGASTQVPQSSSAVSILKNSSTTAATAGGNASSLTLPASSQTGWSPFDPGTLYIFDVCGKITTGTSQPITVALVLRNSAGTVSKTAATTGSVTLADGTARQFSIKAKSIARSTGTSGVLITDLEMSYCSTNDQTRAFVHLPATSLTLDTTAEYSWDIVVTTGTGMTVDVDFVTIQAV